MSNFGFERLRRGIAFELGPIMDKNCEGGEVKKGRVFWAKRTYEGRINGTFRKSGKFIMER